MKPVLEVNDGIINTVSGIEMDLLNPSPEMIDIIDISNSLGMQCRFGGHVSTFYSVAQHSVLVAAMAPPELRKYALMHDAAEAYLQDITAPLKRIWGPAYNILEEQFMKAISIKFELDIALFKEVKPFDIRALEIEHAAFQCGKLHEWQTECRTLDLAATVYGPQHAGGFFLSAFYTIFGSAFIK